MEEELKEEQRQLSKSRNQIDEILNSPEGSEGAKINNLVKPEDGDFMTLGMISSAAGAGMVTAVGLNALRGSRDSALSKRRDDVETHESSDIVEADQVMFNPTSLIVNSLEDTDNESENDMVFYKKDDMTNFSIGLKLNKVKKKELSRVPTTNITTPPYQGEEEIDESAYGQIGRLGLGGVIRTGKNGVTKSQSHAEFIMTPVGFQSWNRELAGEKNKKGKKKSSGLYSGNNYNSGGDSTPMDNRLGYPISEHDEPYASMEDYKRNRNFMSTEAELIDRRSRQMIEVNTPMKSRISNRSVLRG
jgi:hypothetical protein